jgi:hypothetical protein
VSIICCIIIIDGLDFDELVKEKVLLKNNSRMFRARDRKFHSDDLAIFCAVVMEEDIIVR